MRHNGPQIHRTKDDLLVLLGEQLGFIKTSSDAFDNGFEAEGKRLASSIRLLVHNTWKPDGTPNQISLLTQLNVLYDIDYFETFTDPIIEYDKGSLFSRASLIYSAIGPRYLLSPNQPTAKVSFDAWWKKILIIVENVSYDRKSILLNLTERDGGQHIDPTLDAFYHLLSHRDPNFNLMSVTVDPTLMYSANGDFSFPLEKDKNKIELAIARISARELELTLRENLSFIKMHE
jgi:hypothetical protein